MTAPMSTVARVTFSAVSGWADFSARSNPRALSRWN
jgi:hypothetical protein